MRDGSSPAWEDAAMFKQILVPIDLSDLELAKPAIANAAAMAKQSGGTLRLINVLPLTPVLLAEYLPPDFAAQQGSTAGTAPNQVAMRPARKSPSMPEVPVNIVFTDVTRPSISLGVRDITSEWRITTLIESAAP